MNNSKVYICYSQEDADIANSICTTFEEKGLSCWIASRDIAPGTIYSTEILSAILDCEIFVLLFTRQANNSDQVIKEVNKAFIKRKRIITVLIDDICISDELDYYLNPKFWFVAYPNYFNVIDELFNFVHSNLCDSIYLSSEKKSIQTASEDNNALLLRKAKTYESLGMKYMDKNHINALYFLNKALNIRKSVLPENDVLLAKSYKNLARLFFRMKDNERQLKYQCLELSILEKLLGENHESVLKVKVMIGNSYRSLNNSQKALEYLLQVEQSHDDFWTRIDKRTAKICYYIGCAYHMNGDYENSLKYLNHALYLFDEKIHNTSHANKTKKLINEIVNLN